ncbi:unnamed protein product [Periconia digitata]|uniref:Cofilin n=1 Tax=Periconia digitata TaxID=1303443 RepID=A0A9W4UET0_9PLEO|nr:unnamed protein product [Periconia digitata]
MVRVVFAYNERMLWQWMSADPAMFTFGLPQLVSGAKSQAGSLGSTPTRLPGGQQRPLQNLAPLHSAPSLTTSTLRKTPPRITLPGSDARLRLRPHYHAHYPTPSTLAADDTKQSPDKALPCPPLLKPTLLFEIRSSPCVSVAPECISAFNELKLGKDIKYIIYKISDDWKEIVVEETSKDGDWTSFREKLINAKSKDRRGKEGIGGRYAVFDFTYESGEGPRSKITFISWCPDDAPQYPRMMYSSSKEAIKRALNGLAADIQANDADDIEWDSILNRVSKGR